METASHEPPALGQPFVYVAYVVTARGTLRPAALPDRCRAALRAALAGEEQGEPCHIVVNHWRTRVTGPCFPICVARCETHTEAFTVYPAGHIPYGQSGVAPVAVDGETLLFEPPEERTSEKEADVAAAAAKAADSAPPKRELAWETTFFGAAHDAARRIPWPRVQKRRVPGVPEPRPRWWQTQRRYIRRGARVLGLAEALDDVERDRRANDIPVPVLRFRDARESWQEADGYKSGGAVVTRVAAELPLGHCVLDRILVAGAFAGEWGRPYRWDYRTSRIRDLVAERRLPP